MSTIIRRVSLAILSLIASVGVLTAVAPTASASGCAITRYGYSGLYWCGTHVHDTDWWHGQQETFIVGANGSVWHTWPGAGGWANMGGWAKNIIGNEIAGDGYTRVVLVVGGDDNQWCSNDQGRGAWTGWYRCGV